MDSTFSTALAAWEAYDLSPFADKRKSLLAFEQALQRQAGELSAVVSFHLAQAGALLAAGRRLEGVTGESNDLTTRGRGVALIIVAGDERRSWRPALAFLTAALAAGNSVIVSSDDHALRAVLDAALRSACFPCGLIQFVAEQACHRLLEVDVRSVGYVGSCAGARKIDRQLADREGTIAALVAETDLQALPMAHDPCLSLRFVTEYTLTIDTTAVGGNATLLASGDDTHHSLRA